jgi:hypothetical protein
MIPENLVIKLQNGDIIRVDSYLCHLTKKPTSRLSCIEDDTCTQDLDGEWVQEYNEGSCYLNIDTIDKLIAKLTEVRAFLQ